MLKELSATPKGRVGQGNAKIVSRKAHFAEGNDLLDAETPASEKRREMSSFESQVVVVPEDHSLGMAEHVQPSEQGQVRYLPS